jgi:hypothetical protein
MMMTLDILVTASSVFGFFVCTVDWCDHGKRLVVLRSRTIARKNRHWLDTDDFFIVGTRASTARAVWTARRK